MTKQEKKMKKYTNAIERRLNLPPAVKHRVMSDFISSIAARREAGLTDEEIYQELGDAKKAAANLNEQMKEFAYRKSPWRFAFAALAAYGGIKLLGLVFNALAYWAFQVYVMLTQELSSASSVGIIGGADGPTAIFLTISTPDWLQHLLMLLLLSIGIWGFLKLSRLQPK